MVFNFLQKKTVLTFLSLILTFNLSFSQVDSSSVSYNSKRLRTVIATEAVVYAGSLYLLNDLWYKDYPRSSFHFFNDNNEWLQMDKCGHATTSCTIGIAGYEALRWCGVDNTKAIWYGGCLGSLYMLNIEVLDGLSKEWGFSPGDFTANTIGSFVFITQQLAWNEQRIKLKWSYHTTEYPKYRPSELGTGITQTWLKDYNGQTYWVSGNIASFLQKDSHFPKWLNIAFGYGAEGMIGAASNPPEIYNGIPVHFNRFRKFFISPDIDFTKIKTKSKFLRAVFYALNFLKFPAPAFEYSPTFEFSKKNHFKFRAFYF